jgi:hypothetical protein
MVSPSRRESHLNIPPLDREDVDLFALLVFVDGFDVEVGEQHSD